MIAAYQRISRADGDLGKDGKDKSNSIENQKELIQRYISCKESLQNVPVMDFVDDGYTGSNFDRPGFQQMMDGVRNGKIDTIIVKDLSRFGRDYIGVGEYMEQIFPLLGVRLIAINDNYDSNNYKGTTLGMDVVVSNLVNTMYCRDAGKKLRTANQVKWRKGITTASAAPFGYQFDPDKKGAFIIDLPAAKIVRRMQFKKFHQHQIEVNPFRCGNLRRVQPTLRHLIDFITVQHQVGCKSVMLVKKDVFVLDGQKLVQGMQVHKKLMLKKMSESIAAHHLLCLFVQLAIDKNQWLIKIERK